MNPYGPPGASPYSPSSGYSSQPFYASGGTGTGVSEATVQLLLQTRTWVRVISVVMFFLIALMLFGALAGLVGTTAGMAMGGAAGARTPAWANLLVSLFYIPFIVFYIYPAMKLWAYGSAISRLSLSRTPQDLEAALRACLPVNTAFLRRQVFRHAANEAQLNPCFAALERSLVVFG